MRLFLPSIAGQRHVDERDAPQESQNAQHQRNATRAGENLQGSHGLAACCAVYRKPVTVTLMAALGWIVICYGNQKTNFYHIACK